MLLFFKNPIVLVYLLFYLCFFALALVSAIKNIYSLDKLVLYLSVFLMICFLGLRPGQTTDLKMYLSYFDSFNHSFNEFPWGSYGFFLLYTIIHWVSDSHFIFIFLTSVFFVFLLWLFVILAMRQYPYKSLLLLCLFSSYYLLDLSTNTYRQGIATLFIGIGICLFHAKNYRYFCLSFLASISFHWGAIVPIILFFSAVYLAKHFILLRILSIITLTIFTISLFFDLNLLSLILHIPIFSILDDLIFGVDILNKVDSYLKLNVDGTLFYESSLLSSLKYIFEAYIPLLVGVVFIFSEKIEHLSEKKGDFYILTFSYCVVLNIYAVLLISMAWFFRNFYWLPLISMLCCFLIIPCLSDLKNKNRYIFILSLIVVVIGLLDYWPSELLKLSYMV